MSTKNRTRRTTHNIRFPNQMIEQINGIALEQKGSGNFSAWVIEAFTQMETFLIERNLIN